MVELTIEFELCTHFHIVEKYTFEGHGGLRNNMVGSKIIIT
jgi:hypothetical protein